MRTIGGSIGIAISSTLLVRREQVRWHQRGTHLTETNPRVYDWLNHSHVTFDDANAGIKLAQKLFRHVQLNAFNDVFWFIAMIFVCLTPFTALLRNTHRHLRA